MSADDTSTDHDDLCGTDAGDAAKQYPAPAICFLKRPCADLRCKASSNLGHGCQKRQTAPFIRHGLVGDTGCPAFDQVSGLLRVRREVQVGEQNLTLTQHLALDRLRFLHFDDHVAHGKDLFGRIRNSTACLDVVLIGKSGAQSRARLNDNVMAVPHGFAGRGWRDSHTKFLWFDFLRTSDFHVQSSSFICQSAARPWKFAAFPCGCSR